MEASGPEGKLSHLARRYVSSTRAHPWLWLAVYVALLCAGLALAKFHLRIETSFEPLLPKGTVSVAALQESRARSGSTDLYTIAVRSPDAEANVKMIQDLSERLKAWPETQWLQVDQDTSFFADHALLYLPQEDLEKLRDKLSKEVEVEKKRNNPFFVDLRTPEEKKAEDAERWKLENWLAADLPERLGLDRDLYGQILAADRLGLDEAPQEEKPAEPAAGGAELKAQEGPSPTPDQGTPPPTDPNAQDKPSDGDEDGAQPAPEGLPKVPAHLKNYLISEDHKPGDEGFVAVVLVSLSEPATDILKSQALLDRGTQLIQELDPKKYHPGMKAEVVGAYRAFQEAKSVSQDSSKATLISVVLVLVVLAVFFRDLRSLALMLVPLLAGLGWSLGMTAGVYGHLNTTTLFVFSMLAGMGIDFCIHYYARIQEEYHQHGKELEEAVALGAIHTGRAMVSASATTVGALLTLLLAGFQGFVEFGVIASFGIALCITSALLVIPPTLFALERVSPLKRRALKGEAGPQALDPAGQRKLRGVAFALMGVGVLGCLLAGLHWDEAEFEYDFRKLRTEKTSTGLSYGKAIGKGKSTTPAMILGKDQEQMRRVHAELIRAAAQERAAQEKLARAEQTGDAKLKEEGLKERTYVKNFITIETFVPPNQDKRAAVVAEIHELVTDRKLRASKGKARVFLDRMTKLSEVKPFTIEQVPDWAKRSIVERDGKVGSIGYLYSDVQKWDLLQVQDFQDKVGVIALPDGAKVPIASTQFIFTDVIRTVKHDAKELMPIIFAVLFVILLVDMRTLKGAIACLATMAVAVLWTIGGMIVFDIRLGLYNMVLMPMVLGTGVDGAIHLYHRYTELGPERLWHAIKTTGSSIAAAAITTIAGFAGLFFVEHQGIRSIADLAVVGMSACILAVFVFMPGVLLLFFKPKQAAPADPAQEAQGSASASS